MLCGRSTNDTLRGYNGRLTHLALFDQAITPLEAYAIYQQVQRSSLQSCMTSYSLHRPAVITRARRGISCAPLRLHTALGFQSVHTFICKSTMGSVAYCRCSSAYATSCGDYPACKERGHKFIRFGIAKEASQSAGWWSLSLACRGQAVSLPVQGLPSLVTAAQSPSSTYPVSSNNLRLYGMTVCYLTAITDGKNTKHLKCLPTMWRNCCAILLEHADVLLGRCASSQLR